MNLLETKWGRLAAFFLLYVTEGLPLGFAAGAIAVYMRREGLGIDEMGAFIAAYYAPWGFKWAFGPVVDLVGSKRIGHRRGWILLAQGILILTLLAASGIDYSANLRTFTLVMVLGSGISALQDVAIDALAVSRLKEEERGLGNGLMFAGAYLGQALGGSGMLYLAGAMGSLQPTFYAVAGLVASVWLIAALFMDEGGEGPPTAGVDASAVLKAIWEYIKGAATAILGSRQSIAALVLALLPASAMAMGLALQSALAVEVGLSDEQIATLGLAGAIAAAAGSVMGGLISDRLGHRRTLAVYVVATLVPTAILAWQMQQHGWIEPIAPDAPDARVPAASLVATFWWATVGYGFASGLTYGTRMAIFMSVCAPAVAATQFTAYMAGANLAISYSAAWQGVSVERWGYPATLALDCAAGLACLLVLPFVKPRQETTTTEALEAGANPYG